MSAPEGGGDSIRDSAASRHEVVEEFAHRSEERNVIVKPKGQAPSGAECQRAKHRFGAVRDAAVGLDEMDGLREILARDCSEAIGGVLIGDVFDAIAGRVPPARDPTAAEATVAVEHHDRAVVHAAIIPAL